MNQLTYRPTILRLHDLADLAQFNQLVGAGVGKIDTINNQLSDVVRIKHSNKKLSVEEIEKATILHIGNTSIQNYGCWVYYPWKNQLVHLLDHNEFSLVRTIRNQYKLTPKEQNELSNKKVGIIGMSVGHSVAMAIAIERSCGEIRIADFDHLELSNMNRIRTSVLNIGLPKTIIVAREIAELDPFIKVVIFDQGINEENIDSFFELNGKLDVIIEECDSVEVKILVRKIAKTKMIPVVMDTSDRGMIDVERYDLDQDYPILHGLVDSSLDYHFLKNLGSSKEKLPYILPFAGIERISDRLAISAIEIESSITSWPQLGTEVQVGGALAAKATRAILLQQDRLSKRVYHECRDLEIDELVRKNEIINFTEKFEFPEVTIRNDFISNVCPSSIKEILSESLCAPSASNLQPWNYIIKDNNYFICTDRIEEKVEIQELLLSALGIGAILENLKLISERRKIKFNYETIESCKNRILIRMKFNYLIAHERFDILSNYLTTRITDRSKVKGTVISTSELLEIHDLSFCSSHHVMTHVFHMEKQLKEILDVISTSDKLRLLSVLGHKYFYEKEIQFGAKKLFPSGIHINDLMLDKSEEVGMMVLARENVRATLNELHLGENLASIASSYNSFNNSMVIVSVKNSDLASLLNAGMAIQRLWLSATSLDLAIHPMTSPIPIVHSLLSPETSNLMDDESILAQTIEKKLGALIGAEQIPVFICRLFRNKGAKIERSMRMSIDNKLHSL